MGREARRQAADERRAQGPKPIVVKPETGNRYLTMNGFRPQAFGRYLERQHQRKRERFGNNILFPTDPLVVPASVDCSLAFAVTCPADQEYGVESLVDWIVMIEPGVRKGPSSVVFTVKPNESHEQREGELLIAGKYRLIKQEQKRLAHD